MQFMKSNDERMIPGLTACFQAYNDIDNMLFLVIIKFFYTQECCMLPTQRQITSRIKKFIADNLLRSKDFDRINSKKATPIPTPIQILALPIKLQLIKSITNLRWSRT